MVGIHGAYEHDKYERSTHFHHTQWLASHLDGHHGLQRSICYSWTKYDHVAAYCWGACWTKAFTIRNEIPSQNMGCFLSPWFINNKAILITRHIKKMLIKCQSLGAVQSLHNTWDAYYCHDWWTAWQFWSLCPSRKLLRRCQSVSAVQSLHKILDTNHHHDLWIAWQFWT